VPAPLVLGTRERLCPFHPCRGPESRLAFCDGPDPAPHGGPGRWKSESVGPSPIDLLWWTRAPSQTDKRINI
jgi:hypothetical protein